MRVVALVAAYNEERVIGKCIEHLANHGVLTYLIDNESTDRTVEIARSYEGRGLIGTETLPRLGVWSLERQLRRKEQLALDLEADWFIHMDPDEIRLPPTSDKTLAEALAGVEARGYNAVNFLEYTFIPTKEQPEHDHPNFMETMRWYYPFPYNYPWRVNAWKSQPDRVNLRRYNGHRVLFHDRSVYPEPFKMRHYQFLSLAQARTKYLENKDRGPEETQRLSRNWRVWLIEERMGLPSESEMNFYTSDDELSLDKPRLRHVIEDWAVPKDERGGEDVARRPKRADEIVRVAPARAATGRGRLIVAGFHRSGTSLTARLLERSGLFLGDEMLGGHRSNRHGHFEDKEVLDLHNGILESNDLSWQFDGPSLPVVGEAHRARMRDIAGRRDAKHEAWGFKDPRVCLFLEEWKAVVPDARVLLVYRHFAETTRSLHERAAGGLFFGSGRPEHHRRFLEKPDLALKMWLAYNKALVDFAEAYPEDVLAVSFDLLRRNFPLVEALNWHWGLALAGTPTSEVFDNEASSGPLARQIVSDEGLIGETLKTWEALQELRRRTEELVGWPVGTDEDPSERAFYKPADPYASELEKEFVGHDLRRTQERLDAARRRLKAAEKREEAMRSRETTAAEANGSAVSPYRIAELEGAEKDLKLILNRMSGSKAAPLFRLKGEFRELERRYLN